MDIYDLVSEFSRLDAEAAEAYVGHGRDRDDDRWPTVGFNEGNGHGHAVISVHPDDIELAIESLRKCQDGATSAKFLADAGVRCEWHI